MKYGLGRLHAPDPRDHAHLLSAPPITRTTRFWYGYAVRLNQGETSECVAYAWSHFITDAPKTHSAPIVPPDTLYHQAQLLDEFPGTAYDGTSVRGGVKALKKLGEVGSYKWAFDLQTVIANVLEVGPVVVGTNWYERMFKPEGGYVKIGGALAGGHAYKLDGVNVPQRFFRMKNSWGSKWGNGGYARISFDDMERLIGEKGEACMALEA